MDIIGIQEHHSRTFGTMQETAKRMKREDWDSTGNPSLTPKSGVRVLWKAEKFRLKPSYTTCARTPGVVLEDEEEQ